MSTHIRTLGASDLDKFRDLRLEALANSPNSFFTLIQEEVEADPEKYRGCFADPTHAADEYMFGLFDGERLIGLTALFREARIKRKHIAWVQSVYVTPDYRGQGHGRMLVQHAVDHARTIDGIQLVQLSVESGNKAAKDVYLLLGFTVWGVESPAAIYDGVEFSEDYMSLRIRNG